MAAKDNVPTYKVRGAATAVKTEKPKPKKAKAESGKKTS